MVFVVPLIGRLGVARPTILFSSDLEISAPQVYHLYRNRFQIRCNFRDAKQRLVLAACQAQPTARRDFHSNAVFAALICARLELLVAADQALECLSMTNI